MLNQTNASAVGRRLYCRLRFGRGVQTTYHFSADTCTQATNILIADTNALSQIYVAKSMAVQLPSGVVRTGLNLPANKANFGKKVTLYGMLSSYFSAPGLKSVSYYKFEDGASGGTKPIKAIFPKLLQIRARVILPSKM